METASRGQSPKKGSENSVRETQKGLGIEGVGAPPHAGGTAQVYVRGGGRETIKTTSMSRSPREKGYRGSASMRVSKKKIKANLKKKKGGSDSRNFITKATVCRNGTQGSTLPRRRRTREMKRIKSRQEKRVGRNSRATACDELWLSGHFVKNERHAQWTERPFQLETKEEEGILNHQDHHQGEESGLTSGDTRNPAAERSPKQIADQRGEKSRKT